MISRRIFLAQSIAVPFAAALDAVLAEQRAPREPRLPPAAAVLRARFPDLPRHFAFEYYPWYGTSPYRHWDQWERRPPTDLAATSMPLLGAYDSRVARTLEQHARWIADSGAGAINVSWWGPDSYCDRAVPLLMDVMRAHGLHVTFHLEPYRDDRVRYLARDVLYLVREYGQRRRWDGLLLLERADGTSGPVFKSFRTIVPQRTTDCHGITRDVPDYAAAETWRDQTALVRRELAHDFDHVTLLADSLDTWRTAAAGFDGIAVFDNYVRPDSWPALASAASARDLLFSFNVNAGFDAIEPRTIEPGSCYQSPAFEPPAGIVDWRSEARRIAHALSEGRIAESLEATLAVQTDRRLTNARRGFFLVYVNSFNEWHEGTAFEPAKSWGELTDEERRLGYHNPDDGAYRLRTLKKVLGNALGS